MIKRIITGVSIFKRVQWTQAKNKKIYLIDSAESAGILLKVDLVRGIAQTAERRG